MVAADMGGLMANDTVSYFVIAQDLASPANVGSNPAAGLVATNVNTVTTPPTTPNFYKILAPLNGTYTVGAGGNYATLTAAVLAYNTSCITGPIVLSLTDATYSVSETFPLVINQVVGSSAVNTLTIKPAVGVTPTISGNNATAIIRLYGSDYVTIDGSNAVGGTTRDLTITNTNTATTGTVLWVSV